MKRPYGLLTLSSFVILILWTVASPLEALELQSVKKLAALENATTVSHQGGEYVPGEVLVKFRSNGDAMQTEALMVTLGTEQKEQSERHRY